MLVFYSTKINKVTLHENGEPICSFVVTNVRYDYADVTVYDHITGETKVNSALPVRESVWLNEARMCYMTLLEAGRGCRIGVSAPQEIKITKQQ